MRPPGYRFAKARVRGDGRTETKLEASYRAHLEVMKAAGRILDYRARGPVNLRLADKTFFRPDFLVVAADGTLELHETKGYMEDDAAVKLKVAAETYPMFRIVLVKARRVRDGGGFEAREIG